MLGRASAPDCRLIDLCVHVWKELSPNVATPCIYLPWQLSLSGCSLGCSSSTNLVQTAAAAAVAAVTQQLHQA